MDKPKPKDLSFLKNCDQAICVCDTPFYIACSRLYIKPEVKGLPKTPKDFYIVPTQACLKCGREVFQGLKEMSEKLNEGEAIKEEVETLKRQKEMAEKQNLVSGKKKLVS